MAAGFGAFGKMPSLGDFFRVNLPVGFVDAWDGWVQSALVEGRRRLGEAWQDCYMSAPIWRFSLAAGLAGEVAATGVIMPSVDRVGRQYPLTLAAPLPGSLSPLYDHAAAADVFELLEEIALDALDDAMTRDGLATRLAALPPARLGSAQDRLPQGHPALLAGTGDSRWVDPASDLSVGSLYRPSVWSASIGPDLRLALCEGLPRAGLMAGLFDPGAEVWRGDREHV